jgi:outer membrane scaffolding protein for murein synthesis (MipA/OmpV family)
MSRIKWVFAGAACVCSAAVAADKPALPLWEAGVGGGYVSTPAYPGADTQSQRGLALPFLLYRGEILRSDQQGIGARLLHSDTTEFDVGFAASLPAHSEDVRAREGMPDLGTLVEFGPRVKYKLADIDANTSMRVELPLRAVIEVRDGLRRQGWTLEPRLVFAMREHDGEWAREAYVSAVFGDRRINRYFYEVQPQFATASRPAYAAQAGLMLLRAGLFGSRKLSPDLRLFGFLRYESYAGAANRDSPLMKKPTGASIGVGLAWTLARSQSPAHD